MDVVYRYNPDTIFYVIALILIFLIFIAIAVYFYVRLNAQVTGQNKFASVITPGGNNITSTFGQSSNGNVVNANGSDYQDQRSCIAGPTRVYNTSTTSCSCHIPFYNPDCFLESYSNKYTALGQILPDQVILNVLSTNQTDRLSFPFEAGDTTCTGLCDITANCIGVRWTSQGPPTFGLTDPETTGTCELLASPIIFEPDTNLMYDLNQQANIFIKNGNEPQVKDRVFVYSGIKPLRYWLTNNFSNNSTNLTAMRENILYNITYYPTMLINSTGGGTFGTPWVGLASNAPITGDLTAIYNNPPSNVVTIPASTTSLSSIIPPAWTGSIYMIFFELS